MKQRINKMLVAQMVHTEGLSDISFVFVSAVVIQSILKKEFY